MADKLDELRKQLPHVAADMSAAIRSAVQSIILARGIEHTSGSAGEIRCWRKGMDDALLLLRDAREAQERFDRWILEAQEALVTPAEREALLDGLLHPTAERRD